MCTSGAVNLQSAGAPSGSGARTPGADAPTGRRPLPVKGPDVIMPDSSRPPSRRSSRRRPTALVAVAIAVLAVPAALFALTRRRRTRRRSTPRRRMCSSTATVVRRWICANWTTADNAPINQFARNDLAVQQWRFVDVGSGFYQVRSVHSDKVLDVAGLPTTAPSWCPDAAVSGNTRQHFRLADSAGGYVRFINRTVRQGDRRVGVVDGRRWPDDPSSPIWTAPTSSGSWSTSSGGGVAGRIDRRGRGRHRPVPHGAGRDRRRARPTTPRTVPSRSRPAPTGARSASRRTRRTSRFHGLGAGPGEHGDRQQPLGRRHGPTARRGHQRQRDRVRQRPRLHRGEPDHLQRLRRGANGGQAGHQAVALYLNADRSVLTNVRLLGDQDTFLVDDDRPLVRAQLLRRGHRRLHLRRRHRGRVHSSQIHEKRSTGGPITAARTAGHQGVRLPVLPVQPDRRGERPTPQLGRPWGPDAQVLYRESTLERAPSTPPSRGPNMSTQRLAERPLLRVPQQRRRRRRQRQPAAAHRRTGAELHPAALPRRHPTAGTRSADRLTRPR